jgi:hypothetical protein
MEVFDAKKRAIRLVLPAATERKAPLQMHGVKMVAVCSH